jgi:protein-L-isoaspartate(D-aspartate) O-methyltransferase
LSETAAPGSPEALVRAARAQGVRDPRILDAFRRIRREQFVPPDRVVEAYRDHPIPIPHGQVTTQPSLVAQMVAALQLEGHERVLEVGTGLGFQTALLAVLARRVFSIERFHDLADQARRNLDQAAVEGVTIIVGDGTLGLPDHAPFHGIVISAAAPDVPEPLAQQVADGGRLVHPLGTGGNEMVTAYRKEGTDLVRERGVVPAYFVRLVGRHGFPQDV